jgi:assimilatory nitrate reductase catalytic subunit
MLPEPGEARPDWWIVSEVAKRMGYVDAFAYSEAADVFTEFARLSGYQNNGQRDFDISAYADLSYEQYDNLQPTQWPITATQPNGQARMYTDGRFFSPSGKAQFIAVSPRPAAVPTDDEYPLILNSGRIRDHWHTLTRTGRSARLSAHISEPYVEVHPQDAGQYGLTDKALARVTSRWGDVIVRVTVSDHQRPGSVFIPMHWNDQFASRACVDSLINDATDPVSGQPEFKHTPVRVESYEPEWHGFVMSRRRLALANATYWVSAKGNCCWKYEIAGSELPQDWASCARSLLCSADQDVGWVEYFDNAHKRYRAARIVNDRLESCLFIGPDINLPPRDYLADIFVKEELSDKDRTSVLTGKPPADVEDRGKVVCACFNVGLKQITRAIEEQHLETAEAIGEALKAGTNCGSCVPELKEILKAI